MDRSLVLKPVGSALSVSSNAVISTAADTVVPGMSIVVPASDVDRDLLADYSVVFAGGHTDRFTLSVDGQRVFPMGTSLGVPAATGGASNPFIATAAGVPVHLTAGQAHTVELRWQSSDSTSAVTLMDRTFALR
jgi:hypothetical protein